jgi:hypothetical protein
MKRRSLWAVRLGYDSGFTFPQYVVATTAEEVIEKRRVLAGQTLAAEHHAADETIKFLAVHSVERLHFIDIE